MKIRPLGAELFHADGQTQTDRHDEANSRFSQFANSPKKTNKFREGLTPFPTSVHLSLIIYETHETHQAAMF